MSELTEDKCAFCGNHTRCYHVPEPICETCIAQPDNAMHQWALTSSVKDDWAEQEWSPIFNCGDFQLSIYLNETLEIRDEAGVYVHFTKEETAQLIEWLRSAPIID